MTSGLIKSICWHLGVALATGVVPTVLTVVAGSVYGMGVVGPIRGDGYVLAAVTAAPYMLVVGTLVGVVGSLAWPRRRR